MEKEKTKTINYNYFHWGPFLYKTVLTKEEVNQVKNLCSKEAEDYRKNLAGIIKHEHKINHKELFPIIAPYLQSYVKAFFDYRSLPMYNQLKLKVAWVNYMTKFESNPLHAHDEDLSFVLFLEIPKNLLKEYNEHVGNTKPGCLNFIYDLQYRKEYINEHCFFPKVGELFIFPSALHHYVNSFQSEGERISVSGNLKVIDG